MAAEECQLLQLEGDTFRQAIKESPRLAIGLLAALAGRLRYAVELRQDTTSLDVPGRLARVLLRLAQASDGPQQTALRIPNLLSQVELAALVGVTRESINRWLKSFEKQGLIRRDGTQITLLHVEALQRRSG